MSTDLKEYVLGLLEGKIVSQHTLLKSNHTDAVVGLRRAKARGEHNEVHSDSSLGKCYGSPTLHSDLILASKVLAFVLGLALQSLKVTFVVFGAVSSLLFVVRSITKSSEIEFLKPRQGRTAAVAHVQPSPCQMASGEGVERFKVDPYLCHWASIFALSNGAA